MDSTLWTAGGTIAAGLVTALGVLWKIVRDNADKLEERAATCEAQHAEAGEKILSLSVGMAKIEGRMAEHQDSKESADKRLDEIHKGVFELLRKKPED